MLNTEQETLALANEIWTFQALDGYLYQLCVMLEKPSGKVILKTEPFQSAEEDWSHHFCCIGDKLPDVPLRLLVIHHALSGFHESNSQLAPARQALAKQLLIALEQQALPNKKAQLMDMLSKETVAARKNAFLKLFVHLADGKDLEPLSGLTELDLGGDAYLRDACPKLSRFSSLQRLILEHCDLMDQDLKFLQFLPKLQYLNLNQNPVSSIGLFWLKNPASLQELNLSDTNLNSAGSLILRPMSNLKTLSLPARGFSEEEIASLQESLPQCRIQKVH